MGFYFCAQADTDRLQWSNLTAHTNLAASFPPSCPSVSLTQRLMGMSHVSPSTQIYDGPLKLQLQSAQKYQVLG